MSRSYAAKQALTDLVTRFWASSAVSTSSAL
jgi:hypothetical protein